MERSADGKEFYEMENGKLKMENGKHDYHFVDYSPLTVRNYYRLKLLDKDGSFTYSAVRMVDNSSSFHVTVHPNPVKDVLSVEIVSDKNMSLLAQVVAQDGRLALTHQWNVTEGNVMKTLNTTALQSGSYFLKLTFQNPSQADAKTEQQIVKFEKL